MENNEKELTPEESLQLISQVITNTRRSFKYQSFYFLLWGWLTVIAALTNFFLIQYFVYNHHENRIGLWSFVDWSIMVVIGWALSIYYTRKRFQTEKVKNQFGLIIKALWFATGMTSIPIIVACIKLHFYPAPIILIICGLSTVMTGFIIRFKPIIYGGIIFWIFSIVSVFILNEYQLVIYAVAMVLGNIIPGYMLKYSKN